MNPFHKHRMPDPQDCVCAGTCANPPTALEQDSHYEPQPLLEHRPTLNTHYTVVTERFVEPKKHPNAGIGGYQDVQHHSDIGGYYDISRESEIGNDHVDSGGYPIRRFLHKLCHPKEFHKH